MSERSWGAAGSGRSSVLGSSCLDAAGGAEGGRGGGRRPARQEGDHQGSRLLLLIVV